MRFFKCSLGQDAKDFVFEENGWKYKFKRRFRFAFASVKTPIQKEVTYGKGMTVRYLRHSALCVGLIHDGSFSGIAFFDWPLRPLFPLFILSGVTATSESVYAGIIWAFLFHMLNTFLSIDEDDLLLSLLKRKIELQIG